jgi:DNA-binding XRE family transcriptional regulator
MRRSLHNYLRTHRRRTGLYQEHVSRLLGGRSDTKVSRHEKGQRLPTLETALAYAVVYQTSVDELFAGLKETVEEQVQSRARKVLSDVEEGPVREHLEAIVAGPEPRLVPWEEQ